MTDFYKTNQLQDHYGRVIPQHFNEELGVYVANTNGTGDASDVDFSKLVLLHDYYGRPIQQYYDVVEGKFKPVTSEGGNSEGGGSPAGNAGVPIGPAIIYENIYNPTVAITTTHKIVLEDAPNE